MRRFFPSILAGGLTVLLAGSAIQAQSISYKGAEVELGPRAFFVDGRGGAAAESPYIFTSFNEAMANVTDGTTKEPMRVYIAPWVYWVDDPDDPEVRRARPGEGAPIGLAVKCESLQLLGMGDEAGDVVLASARGQTQGAAGNFTMFDFTGSDLVVKDLTMGNYCNIDLDYPLRPELGRAKRSTATTQAQLAFCHGDRIYAENVRFVSRLNLCPLAGSDRTLFVGCHFECTDDSLNGNGVYLNCDFDFWGRQPFYSSGEFGSVFLNCDFNVMHDQGVMAVSKAVSAHSLVDVRYHAGRPVALAWTFRPEDWLRCYVFNVSLDDAEAVIGAEKPDNTVCLEQTGQLAAYRLKADDGGVVYNTWNLLRGDDGWDPLGNAATVRALSLRDGEDYSAIGTCLKLDRREAFLRTGEEPLDLEAHIHRHSGERLDNRTILWRVEDGYEDYVELSVAEGNVCRVTAKNRDERELTFDVIAYTLSGLESAVRLTVAPELLPAPEFTELPELSLGGGEAAVEYALDLDGRGDESAVTWYRCDSRKGRGAIPVSVSRGGPKKTYALTAGDVGRFIAAGISPKHLRCEDGDELRIISKKRIRKSDVTEANILETDFSDFPCSVQTEVKPGFWTVDAFKPEDTSQYEWTVDNSVDSWAYGSGINGAKGLGLQQIRQGARLRYTPVKGQYGDMSVTWQVDPAKDGGQGFASARSQYLDIFINFDTETLSGYALRVIRTTKRSDAVDMLLVQYRNGRAEPISESVTTRCFRTGCVLNVRTSGPTLKAHVEGPDESVDLEATVTPCRFGGLGVQHTGTVGEESRILIHSLKAEWK